MNSFVVIVLVVFVLYFVTPTDRCVRNSQTDAFLRKLKAHTHRLVRALDPNDPRTKKIRTQWTGRIEEMEHSENRRAFAYNINKGQKIAICVHNRHGVLNPFNETFFVLMHELAHVATDTYAHDRPFWDAFRWLIRTAIEAGLYHNVDYSKRPVAFCEHRLDENPTF
jgi:hypothetical protein